MYDSELPKTREQYWEAQIDVWRSSRQSQRAFCRANDLSYPRFAYWLRKFRRRGKELLELSSLEKELPGVDMFLAMDRISDSTAPREVTGNFEVSPTNGPHGHRPVYMVAHQGDDAKVWTSAVFITFK